LKHASREVRGSSTRLSAKQRRAEPSASPAKPQRAFESPSESGTTWTSERLGGRGRASCAHSRDGDRSRYRPNSGPLPRRSAARVREKAKNRRHSSGTSSRTFAALLAERFRPCRSPSVAFDPVRDPEPRDGSSESDPPQRPVASSARTARASSRRYRA